MKQAEMLERVRTANSINIPPEVFEQMFLSPQNKIKGELRQTFGNPTPIGTSSERNKTLRLTCISNWRVPALHDTSIHDFAWMARCRWTRCCDCVRLYSAPLGKS